MPSSTTAASSASTVRLARRTVRYQPTLQSLRGLLFHASNIRGTFVAVPTLSNPRGSHRFPCVEAVLGTRAPVHDCVVSMITNQGEEHRFLVSCQFGPSLPNNRAIQLLTQGANWGGSLLVMKMGQRATFVRLSAAEKQAATAAVMRFIEACDGSDLPSFVDSI